MWPSSAPSKTAPPTSPAAAREMPTSPEAGEAFSSFRSRRRTNCRTADNNGTTWRSPSSTQTEARKYPMTPRQRVEAVLRGEAADKIPFTIYPNHLPPSADARKQLRKHGLGIVKGTRVFRTYSPNVRTRSKSSTENGVEYVKRTIHTPVGDLFTIDRPAGFTAWHVSKLFKKPEDYKTLLFMVNDQHFEPDYEPFAKEQREAGEDMILRAFIGANPLHQVMILWMGVETFSVEWAERRDEIEKLYDAIVENHREIYPIVAQSPALLTNFGGNETADLWDANASPSMLFRCTTRRRRYSTNTASS